MACPAGYGSMTRPTTGAHEEPHIFETIAEPHELKNFVHDAIYLTGGQFAILCQFAHPGLAEGSYKQSNFANRIMNRLKTTARFLNAAVIGTQAEKEAIFSVIHNAHADVKGESYYADDPELHKWTAATLFVSLVVVHDTFFGKMSRETQERLFKESAVYGTSLRMPPDMWPETLDEFWAYWDHNIQSLEVTDWARSLCRDLLWPKKMPVYLLPSLPIARVLTMHWLPERLQREYNLKITSLNTAVFRTFVTSTAFVYPMIPRAIKSIPAKWYIKDMKKAVKRIEETGSWYDQKGRT
ncbi:uncharacterized protein B0I36DRAFT_375033 [Microdochium trichocladiopsis]|uniref:ER-bound oxygenase mpaB/mpaB'/Rubber oxygenase catalytic domain-containing protein n=1 Tax=Microdochium trichocladiopsis TaxID=1682393 RepID=A0A9P9BPT7_9PEZI|nr:uncharacterized protein B0I36DRAFT_375033 [Microdochium trichocladiopsis]KAH7029577.1 hypothetical protein B0I36DRAFT_375033 [Microdochium trichocladiopsis]